jgi:hypothetical protein
MIFMMSLGILVKSVSSNIKYTFIEIWAGVQEQVHYKIRDRVIRPLQRNTDMIHQMKPRISDPLRWEE